MTELTDLTIAEAREGLRGKSFSARELAEAHLAAIDAANEALNVYVLPTPERAGAGMETTATSVRARMSKLRMSFTPVFTRQSSARQNSGRPQRARS